MKTIFVLLAACITSCCNAQQKPAPVNFRTAVSFNPTVLAPIDNTIMPGVEHRLQNRFALLLDAGYIVGSGYFSSNVLRGVKGFALRPALKLYSKTGKRHFYQLQISYKQVDYELYDWLGKACVGGIPSYEQLQPFIYRKKTVSFNAMTGYIFRLSDSFLLELYTGLGIKIKDQRPTENRACYRNNERDFIYSQFRPHSVAPTFPLGVKLMVPLSY